MLFNSYIFIFAFLPITFVSYFLIAKRVSGEAALTWLVIASLFFYGWWNPSYLVLMGISVIVNYSLGQRIARHRKAQQFILTKQLLVLGLTFNLGGLAYFKYANFFVDNLALATGTNFHLNTIVLPLAISFFTFQQIAYLVDTYKGLTAEFKFTHYALFVTFFPQLIAGPIVHHKEMLPQFLKMENLQPQLRNVMVGISIFSLGLFKKSVLADGAAQYATPVFKLAESGEPVSLFIAWSGALAYTFQLYFDFSGYSDMAIGIARLFGICLPLNFHSPYKSLNIVEFWRRWHMTLSRFLRDYIYIPLGGNRHGNGRRYINLMITMLLGGLWHGAGWTFILWGALHGLYLVINHFWHFIKRLLGLTFLDQLGLWRFFAWGLTFVAVVNSWVLFRATSLESALNLLRGMYGFNGASIPNAVYARLGPFTELAHSLGIQTFIGGGASFVSSYCWIIALMAVSILLPNSQQLVRRLHSTEIIEGHALCDRGLAANRLVFQFTASWCYFVSLLLVIAILGLSRVSEFLYFQF